MIKQSLWGLAIVLLALARTCAGDAPSSAQPVGVGSSQSLMLALNDPTVSTITLNGEQFLFALTHVHAACAELPRACIDQTQASVSKCLMLHKPKLNCCTAMSSDPAVVVLSEPLFRARAMAVQEQSDSSAQRGERGRLSFHQGGMSP